MFIDQVMKLLKEKGITQKEMLEACHLNKNNMANWKKGVAPTQANMRTIADFLGVSVESLTEEKYDFSISKPLFFREEATEYDARPLILTEQEKTLIKLFRGTTEEGRFEMIDAFMEIKKKNSRANNCNVLQTPTMRRRKPSHSSGIAHRYVPKRK